MTLNFISATDRLAAPRNINSAILGPSGVGKTTLGRSLDPKTTLFVNAEAGDLALADWQGTTLDLRDDARRIGCHPWELARGIACIMSGPDPAAPSDSPYAPSMYDFYCANISKPEAFDQYSHVFWDSITVAGRWSFGWSSGQPASFNDKGKKDTRGTYGLHGREMIEWLTIIQHTKTKSTTVVGILDKHVDDLKRITWEMQIEGSKAGRELPGIFDQVMTLQFLFDASGAPIMGEDGKQMRGLFTQASNFYGYPAKDRSGCLDPLEPPDLSLLFAKIRAGKRLDGTLATALPAAV